jgi:hypothetical protein
MLWNIMGVGGTLRQLAGFLEECEQSGTVDAVELVECNDSGDWTGLSANVELTLSGSPTDWDAMTLCATSVNADGTVRFAFETPDAIVPASDYDVTVEQEETTLESDGSVRIVLAVSVEDDSSPVTTGISGTSGASGASGTSGISGISGASGASGTSTTASQPTADDRSSRGDVSGNGADGASPDSSDRDVPAFKNPDLLQNVYESCDTFAEMADTLEMDVTAETVRRYMIDFDIHEPNRYNTDPSVDDPEPDEATEFGEEELDPVVLSDGIGLPEDVTVDTLIETVKESNTIYEVKQNIGIDRQNALEMLRDLNLLDLVMGRLATEAERDIGREDVIRRLREASATQ